MAVPKDPVLVGLSAGRRLPRLHAEHRRIFPGRRDDGARDNAILAMMAIRYGKSASELLREGWFRDPYDEDHREGFLMNASDNRLFYDMFPSHPLSILRKLIRFIAENN